MKMKSRSTSSSDIAGTLLVVTVLAAPLLAIVLLVVLAGVTQWVWRRLTR